VILEAIEASWKELIDTLEKNVALSNIIEALEKFA